MRTSKGSQEKYNYVTQIAPLKNAKWMAMARSTSTKALFLSGKTASPFWYPYDYEPLRFWHSLKQFRATLVLVFFG